MKSSREPKAILKYAVEVMSCQVIPLIIILFKAFFKTVNLSLKIYCFKEYHQVTATPFDRDGKKKMLT